MLIGIRVWSLKRIDINHKNLSQRLGTCLCDLGNGPNNFTATIIGDYGTVLIHIMIHVLETHLSTHWGQVCEKFRI